MTRMKKNENDNYVTFNEFKAYIYFYFYVAVFPPPYILDQIKVKSKEGLSQTHWRPETLQLERIDCWLTHIFTQSSVETRSHSTQSSI